MKRFISIIFFMAAFIVGGFQTHAIGEGITSLHPTGRGTNFSPKDFTKWASVIVLQDEREVDFGGVLAGITAATLYCHQDGNQDIYVKYKGLRSGRLEVHFVKALHAIKGLVKITAKTAVAPVRLTYNMMMHELRQMFDKEKATFQVKEFLHDLIAEFPTIVKEEISRGNLITRKTQCKKMWKNYCTYDCTSCQKEPSFAKACLEFCHIDTYPKTHKRCGPQPKKKK